MAASKSVLPAFQAWMDGVGIQHSDAVRLVGAAAGALGVQVRALAGVASVAGSQGLLHAMHAESTLRDEISKDEHLDCGYGLHACAYSLHMLPLAACISAGLPASGPALVLGCTMSTAERMQLNCIQR